MLSSKKGELKRWKNIYSIIIIFSFLLGVNYSFKKVIKWVLKHKFGYVWITCPFLERKVFLF